MVFAVYDEVACAKSIAVDFYEFSGLTSGLKYLLSVGKTAPLSLSGSLYEISCRHHIFGARE